MHLFFDPTGEKVDLKYSIKETTPVMDDEITSSISRICEALTLAPSIVLSWGRLLLISVAQDFSLQEHWDDAKFEFIKYPGSFCACLVQVSNGVCDVFNAAHRSMNRICVKFESIVMDVKSALEVLEKGTQKEWSIALKYLEKAEKGFLKCVKTTASITEEFEKVAKAINELYEVCILWKAKCNDEQKSTIHKIEEVRQEIEWMEESEKNLDERCDKGKKEYDDAAAVCPSPWKTILLKFLDEIAPLAINLTIESLKQIMIPQVQV